MGKMLNLFAATGHIDYPKNVRLYIQKMAELEIEYPWLYQQFTKVSIVFIEHTSFRWSDQRYRQKHQKSVGCNSTQLCRS